MRVQHLESTRRRLRLLVSIAIATAVAGGAHAEGGAPPPLPDSSALLSEPIAKSQPVPRAVDLVPPPAARAPAPVPDDPAIEYAPAIEAVAVLHDSKGSAIRGRIEFLPRGDALFVKAELGGLVPGARYQIHVHEYGDCSALGARSAGEAFGPSEALASFVAGEDGWVDLAFSHRGHALDRSAASVLGRSIVIHGTRDREGCGAIGLARRKPAEAEPPPANLD